VCLRVSTAPQSLSLSPHLAWPFHRYTVPSSTDSTTQYTMRDALYEGLRLRLHNAPTQIQDPRPTIPINNAAATECEVHCCSQVERLCLPADVSLWCLLGVHPHGCVQRACHSLVQAC
jgi:hypothetical protein